MENGNPDSLVHHSPVTFLVETGAHMAPLQRQQNPSIEQPISIALLGATGSIGTQVLEVVAAYPDYFQLAALSCGENVERLAQQIQQFQPRCVCVGSNTAKETLQTLLPDYPGEVLVGEAGLETLATLPDVSMVVVGLVGFLGLAPTLAALKAGKQVRTANKETFVAGGNLVAPYLAQIIPIDSEHSAIHQCLKGEDPDCVEKIWLTASGGPFLKTPFDDIGKQTPSAALKHPNWVMGSRITIDSATLVNKGLEVIEAHWLFNQPYEKIDVVIHPQSMVHSGVELMDGSVLMQVGAPDMRVPILYALAYPRRLKTPFASSKLDVQALQDLTFEAPCLNRFPCLGLAYEAGRIGGAAPAIFNAADEVAVARFLKEEIGFGDIPKVLAKVLAQYQDFKNAQTIENTSVGLSDLIEWDQWARRQVGEASFSCVYTI
jgi:1-deoxy-D-xylulose-5-phosphate reductoisomerase